MNLRATNDYFGSTMLLLIRFALSHSICSSSFSTTNCGIGIGRIIESMATKKKYPSQIFFFSQVALLTAKAVTYEHAV